MYITHPSHSTSLPSVQASHPRRPQLSLWTFKKQRRFATFYPRGSEPNLPSFGAAAYKSGAVAPVPPLPRAFQRRKKIFSGNWSPISGDRDPESRVKSGSRVDGGEEKVQFRTEDLFSDSTFRSDDESSDFSTVEEPRRRTLNLSDTRISPLDRGPGPAERPVSHLGPPLLFRTSSDLGDLRRSRISGVSVYRPISVREPVLRHDEGKDEEMVEVDNEIAALTQLGVLHRNTADPFACPRDKCTDFLPSLVALRLHLNVHNYKDPKFYCSQCFKSFKSHTARDAHMELDYPLSASTGIGTQEHGQMSDSDCSHFGFHSSGSSSFQSCSQFELVPHVARSVGQSRQNDESVDRDSGWRPISRNYSPYINPSAPNSERMIAHLSSSDPSCSTSDSEVAYWTRHGDPLQTRWPVSLPSAGEKLIEWEMLRTREAEGQSEDRVESKVDRKDGNDGKVSLRRRISGWLTGRKS